MPSPPGLAVILCLLLLLAESAQAAVTCGANSTYNELSKVCDPCPDKCLLPPAAAVDATTSNDCQRYWSVGACVVPVPPSATTAGWTTTAQQVSTTVSSTSSPSKTTIIISITVPLFLVIVVAPIAGWLIWRWRRRQQRQPQNQTEQHLDQAAMNPLIMASSDGPSIETAGQEKPNMTKPAAAGNTDQAAGPSSGQVADLMRTNQGGDTESKESIV